MTLHGSIGKDGRVGQIAHLAVIVRITMTPPLKQHTVMVTSGTRTVFDRFELHQLGVQVVSRQFLLGWLGLFGGRRLTILMVGSGGAFVREKDTTPTALWR